MLREARTRHPRAAFRLGNGSQLPFEDGFFDLTFCTGVLPHNPDYLDMVAEMFRVSRRYVVADMARLVTQAYAFDPSHSYMVLKERFPEGSEGIAAADTRVPYVLANVAEAFNSLLARVSGRLAGIAGCGYYGTPHKSVSLPITPVIFTVVLLVKGQGPPRYHFQLPDEARAAAETALRKVQGIKVDSVKAVLAGHRV
jgi:SAM-dependent methyltransferase